MVDICEFCGKEKEVGSPTPFHGSYCVDCMRMNIEYDKESVAEMKPKRKRKITESELENLKRERDEAIESLTNF